GGDPHAEAPPRWVGGSAAHGRDTDDRSRRSMDEPLLSRAVRGLPFLIQAGLAGAEGAFAGFWRGARPASTTSALGKDVHDGAGKDSSAICTTCGLQSVAPETRSARQVPQFVCRTQPLLKRRIPPRTFLRWRDRPR